MDSYTDSLISKYECGVKMGEIWYAINICAEPEIEEKFGCKVKIVKEKSE